MQESAPVQSHHVSTVLLSKTLYFTRLRSRNVVCLLLPEHHYSRLTLYTVVQGTVETATLTTEQESSSSEHGSTHGQANRQRGLSPVMY